MLLLKTILDSSTCSLQVRYGNVQQQCYIILYTIVQTELDIDSLKHRADLRGGFCFVGEVHLAMASRMVRGRFADARHSALDELTFNRDVDSSSAILSARGGPWEYRPSYSGFNTPKLMQMRERKLPAFNTDSMLSRSATLPQVRPTGPTAQELWRTNFLVKHNPHLRGFVTEKVTSLPHTPTQIDRWAPRIVSHKKVENFQGDLLINITTPQQYECAAAHT